MPDALERMRASKRWLLWQSTPVPGKKARKVPFYVDGGTRAATDNDEDRSRLTSYDAASEARATRPGCGLGLALGPDEAGGCWQGVDLDNIETNGLSDLANALVRGKYRGDGYAEVSPSGNGLHLVGYGSLFEPLGPNNTGIEAYAGGRFFTFTGQSARAAGGGALVDLRDYVLTVLAPRHRTETRRAPPQQGIELDARQVTELRSALAALAADDRELWIAMGMALKSSSAGYGLWTEWSQKSEKYDPADAERVWCSLAPDRTNYRAVFKEAQRRGWVNPASNAAQGVGGPHTPTTAPSLPPTITAHHLRQLNLPPRKVIVPGFVVEGLIILSGMPKVGKSFWNLDMAIAVSNGGTFLGQQCRQGPVLYLALEDGQRRLQERQDDLLSETDPGSKDLHLAFDWPRLNEGGLEALGAWCDMHHPLMVLIDTKARLDPLKKDRAGNAYEQDVAGLAPLQKFAMERGIAVVVTTHVRKSREGTDILERVTGSLGTVGTADNIIVIGDAITDTPGAARTIYVRGREIEEATYVAKLVKSRWVLEDGHGVDAGRGTVRDAILYVLAKSQTPMNAAGIAEQLPDKNAGSIKTNLYRMQQRGDVRLVGNGYFKIS